MEQGYKQGATIPVPTMPQPGKINGAASSGAATGGSLGSFAGPIGSLAGSVIGGVVGGITGGAQAHKQRRHENAMLEKKNKFTEYMYDKNNEYNSPANQARLQREGGYNPYYSDNFNASGATGTAMPSASQSAAPPQTAQSVMQGLGNLGGQLGSAINQSYALQNDKLNALASLSEAASMADKVDSDVERNKILNIVDQDANAMQFQHMAYQNGLAAEQGAYYRVLSKFGDAQIAEAYSNIARNASQVLLNNMMGEFYSSSSKLLDKQGAYQDLINDITKPQAIIAQFKSLLGENALDKLNDKEYNDLVSSCSSYLKETLFGQEQTIRSQTTRNKIEPWTNMAGNIIGQIGGAFVSRGTSLMVADKHNEQRTREMDNSNKQRSIDRARETQRDNKQTITRHYDAEGNEIRSSKTYKKR